jgi:hypothetical protein
LRPEAQIVFEKLVKRLLRFFEHVFCVLSGCFQQPAEPSRRLSGAPSAALSRVRTEDAHL